MWNVRFRFVKDRVIDFKIRCINIYFIDRIFSGGSGSGSGFFKIIGGGSGCGGRVFFEFKVRDVVVVKVGWVVLVV